jgi:hypothetical protein
MSADLSDSDIAALAIHDTPESHTVIVAPIQALAPVSPPNPVRGGGGRLSGRFGGGPVAAGLGRSCNGRGRGSGGRALVVPDEAVGRSDMRASATSEAPSVSVQQPVAPTLGAEQPIYEEIDMFVHSTADGEAPEEPYCFFFQVRRKAEFVALLSAPTAEDFPKVAQHVLGYTAPMAELKKVEPFELAKVTELVIPLANTLGKYDEKGTLELWPERKLVDGKYTGVVDAWIGSRPADFLRAYEEAGFETPRCSVSEENGRPRLLLNPAPGRYFETLQWAAHAQLQVRFVSDPPLSVGHLSIGPETRGKAYNPLVAKYTIEKELRKKYTNLWLLTSSAGETQWTAKFATSTRLTDADSFTRVIDGARVTFGVRAMGTSAAKTEQSASRAVTTACDEFVPDSDSLPVGQQMKATMAEAFKAAAVAMKAAAKTWGPMRLATPTVDATAEAVVKAAPALSKDDLEGLAKATSPDEMKVQLTKALEKACAGAESGAPPPTWLEKAKAAVVSLDEQLKLPAPPTPAESLQRVQVKRGAKVVRRTEGAKPTTGSAMTRQGRWSDVAAGCATPSRRRSNSRPREKDAKSVKATTARVNPPPTQQSKKVRDRQHNELRRGQFF